MKSLYQLSPTDLFTYDQPIGQGSYGSCHSVIAENASQVEFVVFKEISSSDIKSCRRETIFGRQLTDRYIEHLRTDHLVRANNTDKHCNHPTHFISKFLGTFPTVGITYTNERPIHTKQNIYLLAKEVIASKYHYAKPLTKVLADINFFRSKPFSLEQIKIIAFQILQALSLLEEEQILHLDLKPANIVIKGLDNLDELKIILIDFGISEKSPYHPTALKQSSWYRHPLADFFGELTHSADTWSLGCILFELITGRPLFLYSDDDFSFFHREQFLSVTKAINGEFPQDWLQSLHPHFWVKYDKKSQKLYTTPKLSPENLQKLTDSKRTAKEFYILDPINQAAALKGYDPIETKQLANLITSLVSYTPPTIQEALADITSLLKPPSPTDVTESTDDFEQLLDSIFDE